MQEWLKELRVVDICISWSRRLHNTWIVGSYSELKWNCCKSRGCAPVPLATPLAVHTFRVLLVWARSAAHQFRRDFKSYSTFSVLYRWVSSWWKNTVTFMMQTPAVIGSNLAQREQDNGFVTKKTRSSATAEIASVDGHYAVQDHSRSPISVPTESPYATSYYWIFSRVSYLVPFPSYGTVLGMYSLSTGGASL